MVCITNLGMHGIYLAITFRILEKRSKGIMTYSEFKTRMTEDVKKYMDGNHPGYEVSLKNVTKVNRDFVEMIVISNNDTHEGPGIDVKELWDDANRRGMSYEEMSREVMKRLDLTLKEVPEVVLDDLIDFKSRVIL